MPAVTPYYYVPAANTLQLAPTAIPISIRLRPLLLSPYAGCQCHFSSGYSQCFLHHTSTRSHGKRAARRWIATSRRRAAVSRQRLLGFA